MELYIIPPMWFVMLLLLQVVNSTNKDDYIYSQLCVGWGVTMITIQIFHTILTKQVIFKHPNYTLHIEK